MRGTLLRYFFLVFFLFSLGGTAVYSDSASCNVPGTRPATAEDAIVKDGLLKVGTCYDPDDKTLGQNLAQAKQDLQGYRCSSSVDTSSLDAKFAVCANKFMQQLRQTNSGACIRSAYRSAQLQQKTCMDICGNSSCPGLCAPPGKSMHQYGLAIDVNNSVNKNQFWDLAAQQGLVNPTGLHNSDPNHVQAASLNCSGGGFTPNTNDDVYLPSSSNAPYYCITSINPVIVVQSQTPPGANCYNRQQSLLYQQPFTASPITAQTPTAQTTASTAASSSQICVPTYSCSGGTMYYQTSSCTTQVYQVCPFGCNGNYCQVASSTSSVSLGGAYASSSTSTDNTNTNSNTNVSDLLNSISFDVTSTEIGTSTSLTLNADTGSIGSLEPGSRYPQGTLFATGTIVSVQPVNGKPTFISQDLAYNPASYSTQPSFAQSVLQAMANALAAAINFLRSLAGH